MDYKIKVFTYKLVAQISDDLPKVIAYFKTHGINLTLEVAETQVLKNDVVVELMQPSDGQCDAVAYLYDRATFAAPSFGLAFLVSPTLRGIFLATDTVDDSVDYTWKSFAHEIMHTLFFKFNYEAFDPMDRVLVNGVMQPYYHNESPNDPDSNFGIAWQRLAPYLNAYTPRPSVIIKRTKSSSTETLGDLIIGNELFGCNTLELSWKDNQKNISCIPKGTYEVKKIFSLKFGFVYEVQNVPNRSGIYFHEGNFFFNTHGCILLGSLPKDINNDSFLDLQNSKLIRQAFQDYMKWNPFTLIIQ